MQTLKKSRQRSWAFSILGLLVIVLLVGITTSHLFHKTALKVSTISSTHPTSTVSPSPKSQTQQNTTPQQTNDQTAKNIAPASQGSTNSGAAPVTPTGTWISNHRPSLGAQPNLSQENSACVSTPGASCYIEFTQGSTVKKLEAQTTDSNGATYWTWDVSKDGFTTGTWQVDIIATLNGKAATATDTVDVQP